MLKFTIKNYDLSSGLKASLFCRNQIVPIIKGKLKGTKKERQNINDNQRTSIYLASFIFSPSYSHSFNLWKHPIKHAPIRSHAIPSKQILLLFYHIIMYNILLSWSFNENSYKPSLWSEWLKCSMTYFILPSWTRTCEAKHARPLIGFTMWACEACLG